MARFGAISAVFATIGLLATTSANADDIDQIARDIDKSGKLVAAAFQMTDTDEIAAQRRELISMYPRFQAMGSPDDPRWSACSKAHQALLDVIYALDSKSAARGLLAFEEAAATFEDQLADCKSKRRRARRQSSARSRQMARSHKCLRRNVFVHFARRLANSDAASEFAPGNH